MYIHTVFGKNIIGDYMFSKWQKSKIKLSEPTLSADEDTSITQKINSKLSENIFVLRQLFGESFDLVIKECEVCGIKSAFVALDGMFDSLHASLAVVEPILQTKFACSEPETVYDYICTNNVSECDAKEALTMKDATEYLISGFMLLFVDGVKKCRAFSVQGYPLRSVSEPSTESQENGSLEGFVEFYKQNVTLVRRRLKSPFVRFETVTAGETSKTPLCVCYHTKRADPKTVNEVKDRLKNMRLDIIPGAGAIKPFLEDKRLSFFSTVGTTERPDVLAAKIAEGRIGVLIDGVPHAIIVPYLFIENFHSLDDYLNRPYYSAISRILKIICFLSAVFLPGIYVAVGTFHQEIFPSGIISDIVASQQNSPFPLVAECIIIHFIYEIVREAGLRMPKAIGHTVSIVGALVIGDAAVTAKLISAPMLIIVALTAICSAVLPSLHEPSAVLRFIFIILGGTMGLYGIMLGFTFITADLCSMKSFGIPFTSPLSPLDFYAMRDGIIFAGWKNVGKRHIKVQNLNGGGHKWN